MLMTWILPPAQALRGSMVLTVRKDDFGLCFINDGGVPGGGRGRIESNIKFVRLQYAENSDDRCAGMSAKQSDGFGGNPQPGDQGSGYLFGGIVQFLVAQRCGSEYQGRFVGHSARDFFESLGNVSFNLFFAEGYAEAR